MSLHTTHGCRATAPSGAFDPNPEGLPATSTLAAIVGLKQRKERGFMKKTFEEWFDSWIMSVLPANRTTLAQYGKIIWEAAQAANSTGEAPQPTGASMPLCKCGRVATWHKCDKCMDNIMVDIH